MTSPDYLPHLERIATALERISATLEADAIEREAQREQAKAELMRQVSADMMGL